MENNYITIPISIIAIFFITFLVIIIKNLFFNSKNYSRKLRVLIFIIGFSYFANVSIFICALFLNKNENSCNGIMIIFGVLAHLSMSICGIWMMIHFDEKKASVRDVWKYRSSFFKNFKLSVAPTRKFEYFLNFIKGLFLGFYFSTSIILIVISSKKASYIFLSMGILGLLDLIINYLMLGKMTVKLIKENSRYNELKWILLQENNGEIPIKTLQESAKKALRLYDILFTKSFFYKNAVDTNNAIVIEIADRGKLWFKDVQRFLTDPISKNESPSLKSIKERYKVPNKW